ncbi:EAL domain-containing protein [Ectopseudomonas composti]
MPLTAYRVARSRLRWISSIAAAALPVVLGCMFLYVQAELMLREASRLSVSDAIRQLDQMLDNAALAADEVLPYAGQPCQQAELVLREQVATVPFVRSVNLFDDNRLYCTSLFGVFDEQVEASSYINGQLRLLAGNPVTPNHSLLVYRKGDGQRGALVAIDGRYLANVLQSVQRGAVMQMVVGEQWMPHTGLVRAGLLPENALARVVLSSTRYPYTVRAAFPSGARLTYMREQYLMLFVLMALLGVLAGVGSYWLLARSSSPRQELRRVLQAGEFIPYFQPLVRSGSLQWTGVEVLMRWKHPGEGLVRPDLFIPLAETCGLIVPMTNELMRQTAKVLAPVAQQLGHGFHVGINISTAHCRSRDLLDECRTFLDAFEPGQVILVLELTERELLEPDTFTAQLFADLDDMGVKIALDDFGTGHSSLSYLQKLKVDYLKIDQSFVAMIGKDALSRHILDSVIELCGKLHLEVVAEGVENDQQLDYLSKREVDYLQGYLFARPMPASEFLRQVSSQCVTSVSAGR